MVDLRPVPVRFEGEGTLASIFAVNALAADAVALAAEAAAALVAARGGAPPEVVVDRRLASLWFGSTLRPEGWTVPPAWDPLSGDYRTEDGFVRLHANAPLHRAAALRALGVAPEARRAAVAERVARQSAEAIEVAVLAAGGCAAALRTREAWREHPQGRAVAAEPLLALAPGDHAGTRPPWPLAVERPLAGVRVLDLTRVLAGPVATRFLAGLGAEVLRVDLPGWDEPGLVPEITLGKRCCRLDLRDPRGRARLRDLLADADVLVHGFRPGALEGLGFGGPERARLAPALVDAALDAYGWTGPWRDRRGFDSLVQMSCGIAAAGMDAARAEAPVPLPAQALDHATGYVVAAAVLRGLAVRVTTGRGATAWASLARTAHWLGGPRDDAACAPAGGSARDEDWCPDLERTAWGPARRLRAPVTLGGRPLRWDLPAGPLGGAPPSWARAGDHH